MGWLDRRWRDGRRHHQCAGAMTSGWRSKAARELAEDVRSAGGQVERAGTGKLRITGPAGKITIHEPNSETRRDLRRSSPRRLISERTGLRLRP